MDAITIHEYVMTDNDKYFNKYTRRSNTFEFPDGADICRYV